MGGRSISSDVKAANSKIAQMLRKREDDEALLQIGKSKVKDQAAREADFGGKVKKAKRWKQSADFSYPSPLVDRPRTESGSTSFHFSYQSISKEGSPTVKGEPVKGFGGAGKSPGADHSKYVERDGAAELSLGAEHAEYLEREGAVEMIEAQRLKDEGFERTVGDGAGEDGEKLTDDEKALLGPVEWAASRSVFSNISDDQFEREEYWRAVHRTESEAKQHSLIVDPSQSPKWWREMETWKDVPEDFRKHCLVQRDRYEAWVKSDAEKPKGRPFVAEPYKRSSEGCGTAIQAAQGIPGWDLMRPPLAFKSGRGGRVQFRFVAELPHELTAEDRALIVQNFCNHLATFSKDAAGRPSGMMYTAVIHAPDSHNDRRNYHLHVIAHDRPAKWMDEHQQWDFEVAEQYNHKGEIRTRYPHRQNKIGEVSQGSSKTGREGSGADFIPAMRLKFAEINNLVLAARGKERRLDPRRYEEMGIERTPTEHLGTKAAAMEAMGVPTVIGRLNAIAIWNDAEKSIRKRAAAVESTLKSSQEDLREFVDDAMSAEPRSPDTRRIRALVSEREGLVEDIAGDRLELMIFDHLEAKAKSRAVRTRQTCLQTLSEADRIPGIHSRETIKDVRKRFDEAQSHIERVDRELAPDRAKLDAAAKDVLEREERIREIDRLLAPLRASLLEAVERERAKADRRKDRRERGAPGQSASEARSSATPATPVQDRAVPPAPQPATTVREESTGPRPVAGSTVGPVGTTPADVAPTPTTETDGARAPTNIPPETAAVPAPTPVTNVNDTQTERETTDAERPRPKRNLLLLAARLLLASREPAPGRPGTLRSADALARVRGLSSGPMVRDAARPPVLLQHLQDDRLGRGGVRPEQGSGDGLRRSRTGDRRTEGGDGEGRLASTGRDAPAMPPPPVLSPPSVQGIPIVQPTLPVGRDAITSGAETRREVPEGLSALPAVQPSMERQPRVATVEVAIDDASPVPAAVGGMDAPSRTSPTGVGAKADVVTGRAGTTPRTAPASSEAEAIPDGGASPDRTVVGTGSGADGGTPGTPADRMSNEPAGPEAKEDGRRTRKDPMLFPVEESTAPTKPGSSKATYEEWDALINEISRDRTQILKEKDDRGRVRYEVPTLTAEQTSVLRSDRFAKRTPGRLAAIHDQQAREIDRLVRWIVKNGRDPEKLVIEGRVAKVGDATDSVRSLMRDWRSHPKVTQALRTENDRRQQVSADAIRNEARRREEDARRPAPQVTAASASASSQARLATLAAMYPDAADAATPQVRRLIELLRKDAPAAEIQAAAEDVSVDPIAREDVHRHRVELAQAYNTAMEDDVTRLLRGFDRRGGR